MIFFLHLIDVFDKKCLELKNLTVQSLLKQGLNRMVLFDRDICNLKHQGLKI